MSLQDIAGHPAQRHGEGLECLVHLRPADVPWQGMTEGLVFGAHVFVQVSDREALVFPTCIQRPGTKDKRRYDGCGSRGHQGRPLIGWIA